jgi:hypothetical protein
MLMAPIKRIITNFLISESRDLPLCPKDFAYCLS